MIVKINIFLECFIMQRPWQRAMDHVTFRLDQPSYNTKKLVFQCQSHFRIDCCIITIHICNEFLLIDLIFYCNILEREKQNSNQVQKVFWTWVSLNCNSEYLIKCFIFSTSSLFKKRHNANRGVLITILCYSTSS